MKGLTPDDLDECEPPQTSFNVFTMFSRLDDTTQIGKYLVKLTYSRLNGVHLQPFTELFNDDVAYYHCRSSLFSEVSPSV